jgi:hypothetical protein
VPADRQHPDAHDVVGVRDCVGSASGRSHLRAWVDVAVVPRRAEPLYRARQDRSSLWTASAPTSGASGARNRVGVQQERARLRASEPAVERDQLLERAASSLTGS